MFELKRLKANISGLIFGSPIFCEFGINTFGLNWVDRNDFVDYKIATIYVRYRLRTKNLCIWARVLYNEKSQKIKKKLKPGSEDLRDKLALG
jgi:hypothetical protein